MADYDFRTLSPHDFEWLCRDLLQKALGVSLESFTGGPRFRHRFSVPVEASTPYRPVQALRGSGYDALARVSRRRSAERLTFSSPRATSSRRRSA